MRILFVASLLTVLFPVRDVGAQNLITNHSFESPTYDPNFPPLMPTGWFSSNDPNNIYLDGRPTSQAFVTDGSQYAQIGAFLEQNTGVAVTPGATYRFEFDYVSFTDDANGPAYAQVFTNPDAVNDPLDPGNEVLLSEPLVTGPVSTVLPQSFDVTAPGTASGFLFVRFLNGTNYRGLDNVRFTLLPPSDDADFDGDDDVDGTDFLIWQRNVATTSPMQSQGNANGDSVVDGADLAIWEQQFGSSVAAASAVPEPTSALLLVGGGALVLWIARRRS